MDITNGAKVTASGNGGIGLVASKSGKNEDGSTFSNATIIAADNGSYGISCSVPSVWESVNVTATGNNNGIYATKQLDIASSTINVDGNKGNGMQLGGDTTFSGASTVTANDNTKSGILASKAFNATGSSFEINGNKREYNDQGAFTVKGTAVVDATNTKFDIKDNASTNGSLTSSGKVNHRGSGIYVAKNASLDLQTGCVMGNSIADNAKPTDAAFGGGVYLVDGASCTASSDVQIENNEAASAGDDIYASAGSKISLQRTHSVDENLTLNGDDRAATAWMYDGANPSYDTAGGAFGEAGKTHRRERDIYAKTCYAALLPTDGEGKLTDPVAVKAAYGPISTITPIDLMLYKGGEGYENVKGAEGTNSGFPEPGFSVELPPFTPMSSATLISAPRTMSISTTPTTTACLLIS